MNRGSSGNVFRIPEQLFTMDGTMTELKKSTSSLPTDQVKKTATSGSAVVQALTVPGPAGRLEALLNSGGEELQFPRDRAE
jgi:hypothetical protein